MPRHDEPTRDYWRLREQLEQELAGARYHFVRRLRFAEYLK